MHPRPWKEQSFLHWFFQKGLLMVTGEVWAEEHCDGGRMDTLAGSGRQPVAVHLRAGANEEQSHLCLPLDAISCKLCEEPFQKGEPRVPCVLPCFHTFCRRCLVGWAQQGGRVAGAPAAGADLGGEGFSCPTCRAVCKTPVEALQVNFALMDVVEAEQVSTGATRLTCQECDEGGEATHYCQDCSLLLCGDCDKFHRKSRRSKDHVLHTVAEFKALKQALPRQKRTCKKHTDQAVVILC
jgi:hypothetical protein